jgi:hypothetical protein
VGADAVARAVTVPLAVPIAVAKFLKPTLRPYGLLTAQKPVLTLADTTVTLAAANRAAILDMVRAEPGNSEPAAHVVRQVVLAVAAARQPVALARQAVALAGMVID